MQPEQHPVPDTPRRGRGYGRPWPKGVSQNPSGLTRRQRHYAALVDEFRSRRQREPGPIEADHLRTAALLQSKLDHGTTAEDAVRMANTLSRLLALVGLDQAPEPPAPPSPQAILEEHCQSIARGKG